MFWKENNTKGAKTDQYLYLLQEDGPNFSEKTSAQ